MGFDETQLERLRTRLILLDSFGYYAYVISYVHHLVP